MWQKQLWLGENGAFHRGFFKKCFWRRACTLQYKSYDEYQLYSGYYLIYCRMIWLLQWPRRLKHKQTRKHNWKKELHLKKRKCNLKKETKLFLLCSHVFLFVCVWALWTIMSTHWHQSVMHAYPKLKNLEKPEIKVNTMHNKFL